MHGLHFTFLALAWDHFASLAELPSETAQTVAIFKETVAGLNFTVRDLRLVPLKGALLLAGIPTAREFCQTRSIWRSDFAGAERRPLYS